jgi:hypothetical protein
MLRSRSLAIQLFTALSAVMNVAACQEAHVTDVHVVAVLKYASGDMTKPQAAVGVVDGLYELAERSPKKIDAYVSLLDYYLGSAGGAVLDELITRGGTRMLPLLQDKQNQPVACDDRWRSICVTDRQRRDARIERLASAIEKGVLLCVEQDDPKCKPD